jgi:hypothetical protein
MSTGKIPHDAARRRALVVLDRHDIERCDLDSTGRQLLVSTEAHVVEWPCRRDPEPLERRLDAAGLIRPGEVLVQSPFDANAYAREAEAIETFGLAKYTAYSRICAALGARVVEIVQIERQSGTDKTTVKVDGGARVVKGSASVAIEELERIEASLSLRDEFAGATADIAHAEALMDQYRLRGEGALASLVDQRRDERNPIQTRELRTNLVAETRANLRVVGSLRVPAFLGLSVKTSVDRARSDVREFSLTLRVTF